MHLLSGQETPVAPLGLVGVGGKWHIPHAAAGSCLTASTRSSRAWGQATGAWAAVGPAMVLTEAESAGEVQEVLTVDGPVLPLPPGHLSHVGLEVARRAFPAF